MSAEWCNNTEPHGEHYEPMPPGYSDEARVCFGITVCSRCGEPLHGRTSLCPCFASPMSEQTDPLAPDPLAQLVRVKLAGLDDEHHHPSDYGWRLAALEIADAIRAAGYVHRDEIDRLERWKREAMEVMGRWEEVYEALDRPGPLGGSKAANALQEAVRLRSELEAMGPVVEATKRETTAEQHYADEFGSPGTSGIALTLHRAQKARREAVVAYLLGRS